MHKLLALLLLALGASTASACSCPTQTIEGYVRGAGTLYFATLVEATSIPRGEPGQWAEVEGKFRIVQSQYVIFKRANNNHISASDGSTVIESFQEKEISQKIAAALKRSAHKKRPG